MLTIFLENANVVLELNNKPLTKKCWKFKIEAYQLLVDLLPVFEGIDYNALYSTN